MSVWIEMFHGRLEPDEEMSDWGFQGPVVGPFDWIHTTYDVDMRGGRNSDDKVVDFPIRNGLLLWEDKWYGDWSIFDDTILNGSPELLGRRQVV
jgi:hypothetical protein